MPGGGQQQTAQTVQSSAPADPNVTATVDRLLTGPGGVQDIANRGSDYYRNPTYVPVGDATQSGWQSALTAANNPAFTSSINGTIASLGRAASGGSYGMNDPGYAALRQNAIDDTQKAVNAQFNNSGRFGSGTHVDALGKGIADSISGLDYNNFQNDRNFQLQAASALPQAFQSSLLPSQAIGAVGSAQDANQNAIRQADADLWDRQYQAPISRLSQLTSALAGNSATAGTTSTSTQYQAQPSALQSIFGGILGLGALL